MKVIISLAVALFLGMASASFFPTKKISLMAIHGDGDLLKLGDFFNSQYGFHFDLTYGTEYRGGAYTDSDAPDDGFNFEEYKFNTQAIAEFSLTKEFFSFDKSTHYFEFYPFNISPYVQQIIWRRPEDSTGPFNLNFWAARQAELMALHVRVVSEEKTTLQSVVDYAEGDTDHLVPSSSADWTYNEDYQQDYIDPWWHFDLGEFALGEENSLLGEHVWYNKWILDNQWSTW